MNTRAIAYSGFLDLPPSPSSNATAFWIFSTATLIMVVASVVVAVLETYRLRSALPLTVFASATLWLPNEPFVDAILGFQYAEDSPVRLFTLWGRVIPLGALGIGAMFFLFSWSIYRMVQRGVSMTRIIVVCVVAGVIDWPLEWGAIHWGLFEYYGDNPSRILGLPLTSMVQNCFIYALMAAAILFAAPHLRGWRMLLFIPVIPGLYLGGAAMCTWPAYLALHAGWSTPLFLVLALVAAAMNVYIPLFTLSIASRYYSFATELPARDRLLDSGRLTRQPDAASNAASAAPAP